MTKISHLKRLVGCALLALVVLGAQTFDKSANSTFKGTYYLRQVLLSGIDTNTGVIGRSRGLIGTATLDGAGNYTFAGTLMDTQSGSPQAFTASGTFVVSPNGLAQMQNPLEPNATVDGGVGLGAFAGSSTESTFQDFLVMIPAGTAAVTNSSLTGSYRVGALEFLQGKSSLVRDSTFTLTSTGNGTLGNVSVRGSAANLGNTALTQTVAGVTYSLGSTPGTLILPLASGTADAQLISGTKTLYISADGNILLGGSPGGFDMLVGIRATPAGVPASISGTFYIAGLEEDTSTPTDPVIDAFYGSLNGTASGLSIWHERLNTVGDTSFDNTFASIISPDATGAVDKSFIHYDLGANGRALLLVGRASQYTLALGLHADDFTASGNSVFLNPIGVANAAGFAPITNSVAPNEFISLFGTGLASAPASARTLPLPNTLGGVSVTVNGRPASLFFVSPQQINALVPFNLPEDYATIQVMNNGVSSNPVTVYTNNTSPAVFTLPPNGVSSAAALHSDFTLVNANSPAKPGETILVYLTGLGTVIPAVQDGAAGPSSPLSATTAAVRVFFDNNAEGAVSFSGLAPGFAGLYQINVKLPANAPGGVHLLTIDTPDALNQEAVISIAASPTGTSVKEAGDKASVSEYRPARSTKPGVKTARESGARRSNAQ
ncbi:MAG: hypothetical protein M3Y27_31535 [Acidobacteriota bacterium]|nr:hypothetical protein [Acidobacteriota bacterium]